MTSGQRQVGTSGTSEGVLMIVETQLASGKQKPPGASPEPQQEDGSDSSSGHGFLRQSSSVNRLPSIFFHCFFCPSLRTAFSLPWDAW